MSNRRASDWSRVRSEIRADRAERPAVYEDRLRTASSFTGNTGLDLSCWVGRSRRRFVVGVYTMARACPADLTDSVVLFVARDLDGRASIVTARRDLTETCAEYLIEQMAGEGCTEVHVARLPRADERQAIVADLSARVREVA